MIIENYIKTDTKLICTDDFISSRITGCKKLFTRDKMYDVYRHEYNNSLYTQDDTGYIALLTFGYSHEYAYRGFVVKHFILVHNINILDEVIECIR